MLLSNARICGGAFELAEADIETENGRIKEILPPGAPRVEAWIYPAFSFFPALLISISTERRCRYL